MALKIVNTESLDAVANAINAKSGTSGALQFPDGFVDAIGAIQAGGGEDLSTALTEQEELVAELKSIIAQKAKLGDAKLPSILDRTVTEITAEDLAGVTKIGSSALSGCGKLTKIRMPDSMQIIDPSGMSNCNYLSDVDFAKIKRFEQYACQYIGSQAKGDMNVVIPSSVEYLASHAFAYGGITNLTLEDNVNVTRTIGDYCFSKNQRLKKATVLGWDLEHGNYKGYQFQGCSALEEATLGERVTKLSFGLFLDCTALKNLIVPKSVTLIGTFAFSNCKALEYIDLTAYGADLDFPTLTDINAFKSAGTSTATGRFEIRVPVGRAGELADMTNWGALDCDIVEVS